LAGRAEGPRLVEQGQTLIKPALPQGQAREKFGRAHRPIRAVIPLPEGGKDMPRISEVTDDRGDPALKPVFDKQRELFGDLLNPTKILAHCPPILRAAGAMGQAIEQSGQLPKGMLPLIYTRVATINGCPF
jgi:hypothetical protein